MSEETRAINLEEIKQREAKATPGPWVNMGEVDQDNPFFGQIWSVNENDCLRTIAVMPESDDRTDDFNFIAYARADIPALIAEIERLQQQGAGLGCALEALRVAAEVVNSKVHQNLLEYAGPGATLDIPLSVREIEALRAALRLAEEAGA